MEADLVQLRLHRVPTLRRADEPHIAHSSRRARFHQEPDREALAQFLGRLALVFEGDRLLQRLHGGGVAWRVKAPQDPVREVKEQVVTSGGKREAGGEDYYFNGASGVRVGSLKTDGRVHFFLNAGCNRKNVLSMLALGRWIVDQPLTAHMPIEPCGLGDRFFH